MTLKERILNELTLKKEEPQRVYIIVTNLGLILYDANKQKQDYWLGGHRNCLPVFFFSRKKAEQEADKIRKNLKEWNKKYHQAKHIEVTVKEIANYNTFTREIKENEK